MHTVGSVKPLICDGERNRLISISRLSGVKTAVWAGFLGCVDISNDVPVAGQKPLKMVVTPAQAGIHLGRVRSWIPAKARMTSHVRGMTPHVRGMMV